MRSDAAAADRGAANDGVSLRPHGSGLWNLTLRRAWPELLLGAALGFLYVMVIPLWEAPDEPYHLANIAYVRKYGLYTLTHGLSELPQNLKAEASQPPLYYLAAAMVSRPLGRMGDLEFGAVERPECWDEAWRFYNYGDTVLPRGLRVLSLVFLMCCALLLGHACVWAYPGDRSLPGTAIAMMWAVPQVMFIGTSISNDALAMTAGALLLLLWMWERHSPSWARCLAIGGIAVCTLGVKFSLLPIVAAGALVAFSLGRFRFAHRAVRLLCYLLPGILLSLILVAAMPNLVSRLQHVIGSRLAVHAVGMRPLVRLPLVWESYWARLGWMNVSVHPAARSLAFTLTVALVMGFVVQLVRVLPRRAPAIIAGIFVVATIGGLIGDLPHSGQAQGRHLFPAIAAFSLLGALGVRAYCSPRIARAWVWVLVLCGSGYVLGHVVPSAYGEEPSDLVLGEACCRGTEVTPSLAPGRAERQAFTASKHGLTRVSVVPATYGLPVRGEVRVSLIDARTRARVASRVFSGTQIRDGRPLSLDFPPLPRSRHRRFVIRVETVDSIRGQLSLFCSTRDGCPGTSRLSGSGDLWFASYHTPHDERGDGVDEVE